MNLTKQQREQLKQKYKGHCSYCGCELGNKWHVDHKDPIFRRRSKKSCRFPNRDIYENLTPACISCNVNKRAKSIEQFRYFISHFLTGFNNNNPRFRILKIYGLIEETGKKLEFYFEKQK